MAAHVSSPAALLLLVMTVAAAHITDGSKADALVRHADIAELWAEVRLTLMPALGSGVSRREIADLHLMFSAV
jgi:hypothetical protein